FFLFPLLLLGEITAYPRRRKMWLIRSGLKEGHSYLEEGIGLGTSPILASRIVGAKGRIYALDNHPLQIILLSLRSKIRRIKNIKLILSDASKTARIIRIDILIFISGSLIIHILLQIKEIKKIADSLKISFFIIGALARDIIMEYFYEIKAPRMTMDIDLGIKISRWKQFDKLINTLEKSGEFKKLKEKRRVLYNDILIDIVPFGDISDKNERISWPPENEVVMSVMGFNEVYNYSTLVRLQNNPTLEVKIPTLPGLAILKLFAWKDNFPNRSKDAEDLLFIMKNYENAGIFDKLYKSELQLLESEDFDNQVAGIVLLGKEMSKICTNQTIEYLRKIIDEETSKNSDFNLIRDMLLPKRDDFNRILYLLKKLKEGIYYQRK
ncbi:unnamed protein product, partial [marine sediment metagenome]